jgi:Tol biopolymer transport system component
VYAPTRARALVRVARNGITSVLLGTDRTYHNPRVSPDGRRISMDFTDQVRDTWLFDIADSTLTRFGFDSTAHDAVWTADGRGLLFAAVRAGNVGVFRRRLDSGSPAESVLTSGQQTSVHTVTPDGRTAIGVAINQGAFDLVRLALDGSHRLDTVLATRYNEGWPALSPDGRWLAYQSDESGRMEVYIRAYPSLGSKLQVSQNGGAEPIWSRDGHELFFRSGGSAEPWLVAASLELGASPRVRSRQQLFSIGRYEFATPHSDYDVFPDGRSFVMVRQGHPGQSSEVVYLQNLHELTSRQRSAP